MNAAEAQTVSHSTQQFTATPFVPRRFLRNPHLQTIFGNYLPRTDALPPATAELVEVSPANHDQPASQVLCHCHWQPAEVRAHRPAVILVHGLEGSSNSQYVIGNANKLWSAGASVIRMNMRNCGGAIGGPYDMLRLTPTLYHSGFSSDVGAVMRHYLHREHLQSISLVGYSMGGNLVVKLAGELGQDAPPQLKSVVGISPCIDLDASATALHRPSNRIYERKFLRALLNRYRRKADLFPHVYDRNRADGVRSLREFDDRIVALYMGFQSAEDYYYRVAAARVVSRIAVPTLILQALDDPFVIITPQTMADLHANPAITVITTQHGGHCAFLTSPARPQDGTNASSTSDPDVDDGYWAETTLRRFILAHA